MLYAAIGGMQLQHWTGYFRIILPTMKVLNAAKAAPGCVHADTFKSGAVFFAVSVWNNKEEMQAFAKSGLHGELSGLAMSKMALFYNHTHECGQVPGRDEAVEIWKSAMRERDGKGTVGQLNNLS